MAATFGRKGLQPGQMQPASPPIAQPSAADEEMARRREAFIASERARRAEAPAEPCEPAPDLAVLQGYRSPPGRKSLGVAYVLWFFACGISAHRFYLGENRSAIAQASTNLVGLVLLWTAATMKFLPLLLTGGAMLAVAWLWMFIDVFLIPGLHRRHAQPQPIDARAVFG